MSILRSARKAQGYTQKQLAEMVGVSQGAVAQWENGISHPSISRIQNLAKALNTTVDSIVKGAAEDGKTAVG